MSINKDQVDDETDINNQNDNEIPSYGAHRQIQLQQTLKAIDESPLIIDMEIPESIIRLMAELSIFQILSFDKCAVDMVIEGENKCTVISDSKNKGWGSYEVATTNLSFGTGIHRFEVLVEEAISGGCRYIGYISDEGEIRYQKGMFSCDYYAGWYVHGLAILFL